MPEVLALVPYRLGTAGGQRTTIEAWAGTLVDHGMHVTFVPYESDALHDDLYRPGRTLAKGAEMARAFGRRVRFLRDLSGYDAVFVHREAALFGPEILERWVVRHRVPLIYGLDDPLFVPYHSPSNGALSRLKFPGKVARVCSLASSVIVNGPRLRTFAEAHNANVWMVPNLVDAATYRPQIRPAGTPPCLGWIGSASTASNLDILAEPLGTLARRMAFSVELIGTNRGAIGDVPCVATPWSASNEVEHLRRFDVGLLPLGDHPWNPWKFNFKLAQYMALGIPPVCTPAGANPEIIEHGVTGFLAATSDDWVRYLEDLLTDESLRHRMALAAAEYAHHTFTVEANQEAIVGAFESALDRVPGGR
jgi:glycosyltransferase involved in cell wall biosynthesis